MEAIILFAFAFDMVGIMLWLGDKKDSCFCLLFVIVHALFYLNDYK